MLRRFIEFAEENKLKVNSLIITKDGIKHKKIFRTDDRQDIRSISKVVSALGVHKAMEQEIFDLDSYVMPFFPDVKISNKKNVEFLSMLKIKHLLTLTTGHERGLMLRKNMADLPPSTDFVTYILNSQLLHEPGSRFAYNNGASYLLSAIVQKMTKKPFDEWVYETVLKPLEIEKPRWDRTEEGICLGATGLYLNCAEVHRIGLLLLNRGRYEDKQIVKSSWVDSMHQAHVINREYGGYDNSKKSGLNKLAYGYHIWVCTDGTSKISNTNYFCDGAKGQYLIISPAKNMVISILSNQNNTEPFNEILEEYL